MCKFPFIPLALTLLVTLVSCTDDDKFHDTIADCPSKNVFSIDFERTSFADLVGTSEFDIAVRAKVERLETIRESDDMYIYGGKPIEEANREILKTLYRITPIEVFPAETKLAGQLILTLPYGIDGNTVERSYDLPILRDGGEYMLLLCRDTDADGRTVWKLSPDPSAAVAVEDDKLLPETAEAEAIFDEFESADELYDLLEYYLKEDNFDKAIEEIPLTMRISWAKFDSLAEMLAKTEATQIVRCRVARTDSVLKEGDSILAASKLDDPSLGDSGRRRLAKSLCTPYVLSIGEVLWSTEEIPDSVTLYVPFGIYGEYMTREYDYPLLKNGGEYILVLRRESDGEYRLAFVPQVMPILGEDYVTNVYSNSYFGAYKTVAELADALKKLKSVK